MAPVAAAVALPCPPQLAILIADSCSYLDGAFPTPVAGEVLNIVCGAPDGKLIYAVARAPTGLREGWLPGDAVRIMDSQEASEVSEANRLSPSEALQRTTLAQVAENWHVFDQPATLPLCVDEVLQVSTVRQGGWAFGWRVDSPKRRGWFPLAMTRRLDSTMASLADGREEKEIPTSATDAWRCLLQSVPQPPPQRPVWQGELPPIVAESAQQAVREMQEAVEQSKATTAMAGQEMGDVMESRAEELEGPTIPNLVSEELPEDCYPLVVCTTVFTPPKKSGGALLKLLPGDLARVTSLLESAMYHGFVEGRPTERGWFPRRNVKLLEDPLSSQADNFSVHIGTPQLPEVPAALRRDRGFV